MSLYIILGFIFGFIFGKLVIFSKTIYKGPNSNIIRKNVYKTSENEYIKFDIEMCICIPNNIIKIEK
jgi:hypothetical protein